MTSRALVVRCLCALVAVVVTGAYWFRDSERRAAPSDQSSAVAAGGSLRGVVRDGSGDAVADAVVEAVLAGSTTAVAVRADALGRYAFSDLEPGEYEIGWRSDPAASGHRALALATIAIGETTEVDFGPGAPRRGSSIRGRVSSEAAPIANAAVHVSAEDRGLSLMDSTGALGDFEFGDLPAGTWSVMTRLDSTSVHERVEADGESDIRLDVAVPRGRLDVKVIDAATLDPVEGLRVTAQSGKCVSTLRTDARGRVAFGSLAPGESASIRVAGATRSPGGEERSYVAEDRDVTIPDSAGAEAAIEVRVARGVALEGLVTGPDGAPLGHPEVRLVASDGRRARSTGEHALGVAGRYRVEGVSPGEHVAVVRAREGAATVFRDLRVAGPGPARADFALPAGGSAVVRVVDGAGAAAPLAIVAVDSLAENGERVEVDRAVAGERGATPAFFLAPGEYRFAIAARAENGAETEFERLPAASRATATVVAGETLVVTLALP